MDYRKLVEGMRDELGLAEAVVAAMDNVNMDVLDDAGMNVLVDVLINQIEAGNQSAIKAGAIMAHELFHLALDKELCLAILKASKGAITREGARRAAKDKAIAILKDIDAHLDGEFLSDDELREKIVAIREQLLLAKPDFEWTDEKLDELFKQEIGWTANAMKVREGEPAGV